MSRGISNRVGMLIAAGLFLNAFVSLAQFLRGTPAHAAQEVNPQAVYLTDKNGKAVCLYDPGNYGPMVLPVISLSGQWPDARKGFPQEISSKDRLFAPIPIDLAKVDPYGQPLPVKVKGE